MLEELIIYYRLSVEEGGIKTGRLESGKECFSISYDRPENVGNSSGYSRSTPKAMSCQHLQNSCI